MTLKSTLFHACLMTSATTLWMACETSSGSDGDASQNGNDAEFQSSELGPDGGAEGDTSTNDIANDNPTCAAYCAVLFDNCSGENAQYASEEECNTMCATYLLDPGTLTDTEGNTIGCRIYHATAAGTLGTSHCAHAGLFGGGTHETCGDICHVYCSLVENNCAENPISTSQNCMTQCAPLAISNNDGGKVPDTSGADLQCHIYHLGVAGLSPGVHCAHGEPGNSQCHN